MINLKHVMCIALVAVFVSPSASARWTGSSGITAEMAYTDNFYLTDDDTESASILSVRPYVNYSTSGSRATASVRYGPAFVIYGNDSEYNDIRHVGTARGRVELVKDIFFIRARANANQYLVSPTRAAVSSTYSNPDALAQTASLEIVPEIYLPLVNSKYATAEFQPGINIVYAAETADGDGRSSRNGSRSRAKITSGRYFSKMPWQLTYDNDVFDVDTDDSWGRVNGRLGYVISPRYRFDFNLGYESVDSGSSVNGTQEGLRWRLDFTWNPTVRTSMTLGGGDAFYGQDWLFRLRHRYKKTDLSADYRVQFATAGNEILDQNPIPEVDAFGEQIQDPFNRLQDCFGVGGTTLGNAPLTGAVYQGDSFNARVGHLLGRNNLSLRFRADRRQYENSGVDTFDGYGCFNVNRALSRNTSGSLSLDYWDHSEDSQVVDSRDFSQYALRLSLRYQLGRRSSTSVSINHSRRDADWLQGGFDENYLKLMFAMRL